MLEAVTVAFMVVLVLVIGLALAVIVVDLAPTSGAVSTAGDEQAHEEGEQAHEERLDQPRDLLDKAA